jgi:hypothetical protein
VSAKALVEFRDVVRVWIEFRAPKKGELMWTVPDCSTPAEALEHVVVGRDDWKSGEAGFGYRARGDQPEFELVDEGDGPDNLLRYRNVVVHVEHVRTEPRLNNVIPHVKLL